MEVGVRNDFCRQDSASPAVQGWLSPGLPQLAALQVLRQAMPWGNRGSSRAHCSSQPLATADRQRPHWRRSDQARPAEGQRSHFGPHRV